MEQDHNSTGTITEAIDNAAVTRYKHKLDTKFPIRERDLEHPSRASIVGSIWTKFALMLIVAVFLCMHTMGFDGSTPAPEPLSIKMILTDLCAGWGIYGLASVFTYFYPRMKNPAVAILMFLIFILLCAFAIFIWSKIAIIGGLIILPIIIIVICLVPFVMDMYGFLNYDKVFGYQPAR